MLFCVSNYFSNVKYQDLCATINPSKSMILKIKNNLKTFVQHNLIGFLEKSCLNYLCKIWNRLQSCLVYSVFWIRSNGPARSDFNLDSDANINVGCYKVIMLETKTRFKNWSKVTNLTIWKWGRYVFSLVVTMKVIKYTPASGWVEGASETNVTNLKKPFVD